MVMVDVVNLSSLLWCSCRKNMLVVLLACGEHISSMRCIVHKPSRSGSAEVGRGLGG